MPAKLNSLFDIKPAVYFSKFFKSVFDLSLILGFLGIINFVQNL